MSRFSPIVLNFNGGEVGPLMLSRVDHDKYQSWCETIENFLLSPQGTAIKRPGTIFVAETIEPDFASELIDFRYSATENYVLEFGESEIRFHTNGGPVLETEQAATLSSSTVVALNAHGYSAGDYIFISDHASSQQNGKILKIASVNANDFTFDEALDVSSGAINVARVYQISHPYSSADLPKLQFVQSGNLLYIVLASSRTRVLARNDNDDWEISIVDFEDGPYLEINPGNTDLVCGDSGDLGRMSGVTVTENGAETNANDAIDGNLSTVYTAADNTWIKWDVGSGNTIRIVGYCIGAHGLPLDTSITNPHPPGWILEGSTDNTNWDSIHAAGRPDSLASDEIKFYPVQHGKPYRYFRMTFKAETLGGDFGLGWVGILPHPDDGESITVTATSITDINDGQGFLATDVGRHIRMRTARGYWVWGKITGHTSTTVVTVVLYNFPLTNELTINTWRLGAWAGSTEFANAVAFFQSRQAFAGSVPVRLALTATDEYTNMSPGSVDDIVTDDDAINRPLNSRQADGARWAIGTERALLIGAGDAEYVVRGSGSDRVVTPTNITALPATKYGSRVGLRPVEVDGAILFFDKTGRSLRELAYVFDVDSYRAPDLTLFAHHMFESLPVGLAFQASPAQVAWAPRTDGQIATFTYQREHEVLGWSRQILGGVGDASDGDPKVKKVCSVTNDDGDAEEVWMVVERYIDGETRYYVERTSPFFEESTAQEDAFFVDCGLTYDGSAATEIGGLWWLEGEMVVALADGVIIEDLTVTDGAITLPDSASTVHVGYPIRSVLKTAPIRGGAFDGTAKGREKRIHEIVFDFWRTFGGQYGPSEDADDLETLNFINVHTVTPGEAPPLVTGLEGPHAWPGSYDKEASVCYVHELPTPCNIRAFMPRMTVEDNG